MLFAKAEDSHGAFSACFPVANGIKARLNESRENFTRERVRQIECEALSKLRECLEAA
jgi:hypothetical protein